MKITIVTAVRNAVTTLEDALRSVQEQDYAHIEHIVIDGVSTDGTVNLLKRHQSKIAKFISEPDSGIYDALNKGIREAEGEVVGFLHSDDIFASHDTISHIAKAFEDPTIGAVYGDLEYVSKVDTSRVIRYWRAGMYDERRLFRGWMPPHPTFYVRRSIYNNLGAFKPDFRIAADYESVLRILGRGGVRAAYIPKVLVKMRVGGASNRSIRNLIRKTSEDYAAMRMNRIGGLQALLIKNVSKFPQFVSRKSDL